MRRRITGVIIALLLASVGTFLLVLYVDSAKDKAVAGERMVTVLVVAEPVAKGTAPSADHVRLEEVPAKARAQHAVSDLAEVEGLVATTALLPGEQVVRERFATPQLVARGDVPPGLLEVTLPVERDRAVGGRIRPGSKVALVVTFPGSDDAETPRPQETHVLMHKVLVTGVQVEGELPDPAAPKPADGAPPAATQAPPGGFLITLALDAPSIERVVFAQETGSLWLAIEPDDAPETGTRHVTRENVYS